MTAPAPSPGASAARRRGGVRSRGDAAHHVVVGLLAAIALNAIGGGIFGLSGASGVPTAWLAGSPFTSYRVPSLFLLFVLGGAFSFAAGAVWARHRAGRMLALASAALLLGWLVAQLAIIGFVSWLQPTMAAAAVVVILLASRLRAGRRVRR